MDVSYLPRPKGMYPFLWGFVHLSGSNTSGLSHSVGSICGSFKSNSMIDFAGMLYPSTVILRSMALYIAKTTRKDKNVKRHQNAEDNTFFLISMCHYSVLIFFTNYLCISFFIKIKVHSWKRSMVYICRIKAVLQKCILQSYWRLHFEEHQHYIKK